MDLTKAKRLIIVLTIAFFLSTLGIYVIAYEQFRYDPVSVSTSDPAFMVGEVYDGVIIEQEMVAPSDIIDCLELYMGTYGREASGTATISLRDSTGQLLREKRLDLAAVMSDAYYQVTFDEPMRGIKDQILTVELKTQGCKQENPITVYVGSTIKGDGTKYFISGNEGHGTLCIRLNGYNELSFYKTYWVLAAGAFLIYSLYMYRCWKGMLQGKGNALTMLMALFFRYRFLLKQLVARDFKTKYKRSALGMAWSFLNPLLTMSVQYVVFSTMFKGNTQNYPIYLLTGIVFFSFFSEATSMGMMSIVVNASLIKKVYMPKYIYPFSRTLSSLVNFVFAMMPLFLMAIITKTAIKPAALLLLFDILCLLLFVLGMTLFLATMMTFFHDTQFLWNVVTMMWQYLTPIFYNEKILPEKILPLYRMNPMYQYITFARTCIIDGISPSPESYFYCLGSALLVFLVGLTVFKKQQDKFVLYL